MTDFERDVWISYLKRGISLEKTVINIDGVCIKEINLHFRHHDGAKFIYTGIMCNGLDQLVFTDRYMYMDDAKIPFATKKYYIYGFGLGLGLVLVIFLITLMIIF